MLYITGGHVSTFFVANGSGKFSGAARISRKVVNAARTLNRQYRDVSSETSMVVAANRSLATLTTIRPLGYKLMSRG
jgi:hypothetical protein